MRCRTSSSVVRRSSCLSLLWLFVFLVPVCSADDRISSWNECLQRDWGDGRVNINVSCNGSDIDVHFFVPVNSVLNNYYTCLLEYICILPNGSSTTPRAIPSPVVNLQPHYNVTTDTPLPGETVCTVRGCYEDIDYFLFAFNQSCTTDVNECIEDSSVCGQHGTCVNTHGSFRCDCHDGYQKNESSHDCIDINECEINTAECPEDATCMNRPGGYWCQLCDPKCHKDALCNTTMENPQCMCREGYTGDGYHCTMVSSPEGITEQSDASCDQVCHKDALCNTTMENPQCVCREGYTGDGYNCTKEITEQSNVSCDPKCHKDALCNTTMENHPQCMCREGYTGNGYHCTKANGKRSNAGQLAIQVMLPLLTLLIIVSIVTTCIVYWRHKHQNRRARFIHYKFDVESKVDLAYDPGILDFSASFTVHSSMGSILHKLNYEQEIPMTAIRDKHMSDGYSTATTPLCDEGDDSSNGLGSVDNGGEDNTSTSLTNEDEDLTSPRPLNQQIYSNGENDSNSSGGSQTLRQHGSVSTATNSSFTGYICETIDMPRSFTFSSNAAVQICSAQDGISTPSSSTQTTKHPVQKEDEVIPVLIIHDENQCPTLHSTSTTSTGYISSDRSPASSIISTHTLPKNEATPTENRSPVSNYDAGTTDATPITPSPPVHVLTTINPQPQRVTSNISLNVITDLEQAFPQMSRFSSGESLDQDLPPPPSLSHLHTGHRTYSQTNLYCYNTGSVHPYENLKTETSLSRPLSHHDITAPFAKTATMSNPRHVDTLYVHSIHTQSGSEHNIPACQTSEPHTPPRVSSSINVYTSTRSGGEKSTMISLKRDKDTIMELSSRDTPSLSSYVNHESAHQLSPHHNSVVVGEECTAHAVNTHSQEDDSEALLQAECQDSVWNEAPDQQQDRVTYSYTCDADNDDGNGFAYSSIHGNVYSATHVENSHNRHPLNRSSTSGFRNILFSLSSEMNN